MFRYILCWAQWISDRKSFAELFKSAVESKGEGEAFGSKRISCVLNQKIH